MLFDRSWYNRAGVERVMGFCTDEEYEEFFQSVPEFERMLVRSGIVLVKYWFSITDDEQHLRFLMRINDPLKQWKLSPMDLESRRRWEAYTKAKEIMLERTHIPEAPWWVVEAVDKKRARLNCIAHLLTRVPYQEVPHEKPVLPARVHNPEYHRNPVPQDMYVPDHYANLAAEHAEHVEARAARQSERGVKVRIGPVALRDGDIGARKVVALEQAAAPASTWRERRRNSRRNSAPPDGRCPCRSRDRRRGRFRPVPE